MALVFEEVKDNLIPDDSELVSRIDSVQFIEKSEFAEEHFKITMSVSDGQYKGCQSAMKMKFKNVTPRILRASNAKMQALDDASGGKLTTAQQQGQDVFSARVLELNLMGITLIAKYKIWDMTEDGGDKGNFIETVSSLEAQDDAIINQAENQPNDDDVPF